mmetsp:Transcript_17297/g.56611  ORF Transcript_17297/g.56611 Transcript_17297/m.56611 type:complete len:138 (-) Transcript_17297:597-1010(-)
MNFLSRIQGKAPTPDDLSVEFWHGAERSGWLQKQGAVVKTWRKRFFVLKQGKIFWFSTDKLEPTTPFRGVLDVNKCLSVKGAEDAINRANAFELSTKTETMFFVAATDKEKEDWINAIGRAIVKHSASLQEEEVLSY